MAAAPAPAAPPAPKNGPNEGPQSKYWFLTLTNMSGRPDPNWPVVTRPDGSTYKPRPLHLRGLEETAVRNWHIPPAALRRMEAVRVTAELGEGPEDPNQGLLHLHVCIKMKSKCRSQMLRVMLNLEPYQYHSEVCYLPLLGVGLDE